METISIIGMIAALCLLSFLVMKGVNIFIAAIASAFVVALTGGIGLYDALQTSYMGGFTGFFGSNFLIFVAGALMGQVYEKTNGAKAIARLIISKLGKGAAMIAVPLAIGILTYGGIAGFVVCFAVFPIALEVYREADNSPPLYPRRDRIRLLHLLWYRPRQPSGGQCSPAERSGHQPDGRRYRGLYLHRGHSGRWPGDPECHGQARMGQW